MHPNGRGHSVITSMNLVLRLQYHTEHPLPRRAIIFSGCSNIKVKAGAGGV